MEPDFKEYEEYLIEIQNYRKNTFDDIINKYTNNDSEDFLIDMKTLKTTRDKEVGPLDICSTPDCTRAAKIKCLDCRNTAYCSKRCMREDAKDHKRVCYDAEFKIPSYSTLTSYFCEPAQKLLEELSSCQEEGKDTSQKEWGKDSGIDTGISETADSSQESSHSSDEEFDFPCRGHDSKVSEKDLDRSRKKSKPDFLCREHVSKVSEKDLVSSRKKSKREYSFRRHDSKVSEDLDSSLKIPICDLSFRKSDSKVFEKDLDSSLKKSKWGNRKPNVISVRRDPALKRDTSFLLNLQLDDLSLKSSNSINCSSK